MVSSFFFGRANDLSSLNCWTVSTVRTDERSKKSVHILRQTQHIRMRSWLCVAGLVCFFVGTVLHIVGMATLEMSTVDNTDHKYGVFRFCLDFIIPGVIVLYNECEYYAWDDGPVRAVQAMAITGLIFGAVAFVLDCLLLKLKISSEKHRGVATAALIIGIFGAIFIFIGLAIWGAEQHDPKTMSLGYSFALTCTAGFLYILGSCCAYLGSKSGIQMA